jgi:hypothetical protein
MGERYPGEITIGGKVPAAVLDELLGQVAATNVSVGGYDGPAFECHSAEELSKVLDESGHLFLVDAEASYGQFEELEVFCVEHGIPFDRHSDAKYEFDCQNVYYRPGMERPVAVASNNCQEDLTDVDKVRPVARELARLATAKVSHEELLAAVVKAGKELDEALPPEVEPLPPLEIVECP